MKKRRVNWDFGNPACTAWEVETAAGLLVVRRNHALVRTGALLKFRVFALGNGMTVLISSSLINPVPQFQNIRFKEVW